MGGLTFSKVTAGSGAFNLGLACNGIVYAWGDNDAKAMWARYYR
jgi:alpha-tubulin suppressor-like RCC1 family protein